MSGHPEGNSAGFACTRIYNALREIDILLAAYIADREMRIATVEKYGNKKGKSFKKAQIAAIMGDEDALAISKLHDRKMVILDYFIKVWDVYAGEGTGEIVACYIENRGNIAAVRKLIKRRTKAIDEALATWYDFVRVSSLLAKDRMKEANIKGNKYDAKWYSEIGKKENSS